MPINHEYIQDLNVYDIEFYEYSIICDDPKLLEKLENSYVDPDYDKWVEEFEQEQNLKAVELPDSSTIAWNNQSKPPLPSVSYETYEDYTTEHTTNDWIKED